MCLYHLAAWGYWALSGQAPFSESKTATSAWLGTNLENKRRYFNAMVSFKAKGDEHECI
jgi:hypothetical protein